MKKFSIYSSLSLFVLITMLLTGCSAVAGIFKAGVWVGVVAVVIVIFIIIKVVSGRKE